MICSYHEVESVKPGNDLLRHGAIVLAGTLCANVLGYAYHFAMSRLLGVDGYGSMLGFFSLVTLVGIPAMVAQTVVAKTIASYVDAHRVDRIRRFVRTVVASAAAVALVATAALCALRDVILAFLHSSDATGVYLVAWAVFFYLTVPVLNGILQGDQRFAGFAISTVSDAVIRAALAIAFVARGYGVNGALLAIAIGATLATLLSASFVADLLPAPLRKVDPAVRGLGLLGSLQVSAGILVIATLASVDVLLVKHFRTTYEAGLFGSLALVGRIVYLISNFVPTIVLPKATARVNAGRSPIPLLAQAAAVFVLALSFVMVPLLAAPGFVLRTIAGGAYAGAAPLLALYGSAIAFLAAGNAAANYNIGVNRLGFVIPVTGVGIAEIVAIAFRHDSLASIVEILAIGHFLIFLATVSRIWVYGGSPSVTEPGLAGLSSS